MLASDCQSQNIIPDVVGPDTFTFEELLRDMVLILNEVDGLMGELLTPDSAPTGATLLSNWLNENTGVLGRRFVSEVRRNIRRWMRNLGKRLTVVQYNLLAVLMVRIRQATTIERLLRRV